jgi:hypothetical protein
MAICLSQLVSHCAAIRRIIPNSGRRNFKMVFREILKNRKRLLSKHDTVHKMNKLFKIAVASLLTAGFWHSSALAQKSNGIRGN